MPKITLVEAPEPGASIVDHASGTSIALGESVEVDGDALARIEEAAEALGYRLEVDGAAKKDAPADVGEPTTDPVASAAPSAPYVAQ